jgi:hypothetical protein
VKDYLPSKFIREDQERLAELLMTDKARLSKLDKHFEAGLTDVLIASEDTFGGDMKGNTRKLSFLATVPDDKSELAKVLKQVPAGFIRALSIIYNTVKEQQNSDVVRACIVNSLMAKAGQEDNLKSVVESKMVMLDLA